MLVAANLRHDLRDSELWFWGGRRYYSDRASWFVCLFHDAVDSTSSPLLIWLTACLLGLRKLMNILCQITAVCYRLVTPP